jgi:hypothetical protein
MVMYDASNAHFQYLDVVRHWSAISEPFAGGDALITRLNDGWQLKETVFVEEYWHAGVRLVTIYHFELERDGETEKMPVLSNPYVNRILRDLPVQMRPLAASEAARQSVGKIR